MKKVDIISDKELLKVIDEVVRIGYNRLQATELYRLDNTFYDREEFKNDLFLYVKSSHLLKRFDSSKSSLKTYIVNYAIPTLVDKIVRGTGQFLYKSSNYAKHKIENRQMSFVYLDKLNADSDSWDRLEASPKTKLSDNLFYKKGLKVILKKMLKEHPHLTPIEKKVFNNIINDNNNNEPLKNYTTEKIRRFMKSRYNITKISDIPVNKIELY